MAYRNIRNEGGQTVGDDDFGNPVPLTPTKESMGGRVDEFKDSYGHTYETNYFGTGHKKDDN